MSWQSPAWLWALLALPLALAALAAWSRRSASAARAYADPRLLPVRPGRRTRGLRAAAAALATLSAAAGIVAMARPSVTDRSDQRQSTVVIAIDVSRSMLATDLRPDRLRAAAAAASRFLDEAPPEVAVGLVTFAQTARVVVAPTTERDAMRRALAALEPPRVGSALGEAVVTSLSSLSAAGALEPVPARPEDSAGRILLLTDGANSVGRTRLGRFTTPEAATERAVGARVPLYTMLLGDDPGRPDQATPAEILSGMATRTGGVFAQSTSTEDLRRVFADIGSVLAPVEDLRELTVWAAAAALALLVLAALLAGLAATSRPGAARPTARALGR